MNEIIEFRGNSGLSATIIIRGDPEKVTVELQRVHTPLEQRVILRNPGLVEQFADFIIYRDTPGSYCPNLGGHVWFEDRIRYTFEQYSKKAKQFIEQDEEQIRKILEDQKTETEKTEELNRFVETLKTQETPHGKDH